MSDSTLASRDKSEHALQAWSQQQRCAEAMVPIIGELYREHGVIVTLFGNSLVNKSPLEILELHRIARVNVDDQIHVGDTHPILSAMAVLDLAPARIDIGNLVSQWRARADRVDVGDFVRDELAGIATGKASIRPEPQDVVLYGFGRIGRLVARILAGKTGGGDNLRLRAIVVRPGGKNDLAEAGEPAATRFDPRAVLGRGPDRREGERPHHQRQPGPRALRERPRGMRLRGLRDQGLDRRRQYGHLGATAKTSRNMSMRLALRR